MNWSLINEVGIDDTLGEALDAPQQLQFPTFAGCASDGSYLIADELGKEKLVPFRLESRTMRIGSDGEIVFDTTAVGISDGFGCLCDDGTMAVLRRTKWELLLLSSQGAIMNRLPLATISKRLPRLVSWTVVGTLIVSFSNRAGDLDLVEIDPSGRVCWFITLRRDQIGIAGSIQWTPTDTCLIADPVRHVAFEIDRQGSVVWQFGELGQPSSDIRHLSSPGSARVLPEGRRLIADTRNHRVLLVNADGTSQRLPIQDTGLCDPMYADMLENGHCLICDTGNSRVIELDAQGRTVWHYGNCAGTEPVFSYPRSVEIIDSARYLVADTAHDRIVEAENGTITPRPFRGQPPLFWPRCARIVPSGGLIIADGRNGRVVELAANGELLNELTKVKLDGSQTLGDPHDVRMLPSGNLLIVDSMNDLVVETDWSGHVYRAIGHGEALTLSDPHSAQCLPDGSIVIADTGNHRVLVVGQDGCCVAQLKSVRSDDSCFRLHTPRYVEVIEDGTMVIADTGNNRVLTATLDGCLIWEFSRVPGSHLARLNQPRWASLISRYEVVVCDHFHHRILHARCDGSASVTSIDCQDIA